MKTNLIQVMSMTEAVLHVPKPNTTILRLLDSEVDRPLPLKHEASFAFVDEMRVDDIHPEHLEYEPDMVVFGDSHFLQMNAFFDQAKAYETVIFHCTAGISRSSAIGILFARYLNRLDLECVICLSHWIRPNPWILSFEKRLHLTSFPEHLIPLRNQLYQQVEAGKPDATFTTIQQLLSAYRNEGSEHRLS